MTTDKTDPNEAAIVAASEEDKSLDQLRQVGRKRLHIINVTDPEMFLDFCGLTGGEA